MQITTKFNIGDKAWPIDIRTKSHKHCPTCNSLIKLGNPEWVVLEPFVIDHIDIWVSSEYGMDITYRVEPTDESYKELSLKAPSMSNADDSFESHEVALKEAERRNKLTDENPQP